MKSLIAKPLMFLISVFFLLGLGSAGGIWLAVGHYRPLLDDAGDRVIGCVAARNNLLELVGEQGQKLGALVLAGTERQARAEQAVRDAQAGAQTYYAAANRLQQGRTGGDQCAAAASVIDKELGL